MQINAIFNAISGVLLRNSREALKALKRSLSKK
jgi:hypothetical protein